MESDERTGATLAATAVLGWLLFQPMVIRLFDGGLESTVAGVPLFYAYLFAAWAVLIALLAAAMRVHDWSGVHGDRGPDKGDPTTLEAGAPKRR